MRTHAWQAFEAADFLSESPQEAYLVEQLRLLGSADAQLRAIFSYHRAVSDRQPLSRTLLELGAARQTDIARWLATFHQYLLVAPAVLRDAKPDADALPEAIARSRLAVVVQGERGQSLVVIADPEVPHFNQVKYALEGRVLTWAVAPQADVEAKVQQAYRKAVSLDDNEVERFVEDMLREAALTRGVSDIHCIPEERSVDIRWRVDGNLIPWRVIPGDKRDLFVAQMKLSSARGPDGRTRGLLVPSGLDVANRLDAQDASAVREYGSKRVALRYSVIPAIAGESIVVRILDQDGQIESLESLGMAPDAAIAFREALLQKNGLILITGPTGHGKSTTLAAAVPSLDAGSQRILSVEDPVEYRLRNVTQFPVSARLPWAAALRAFLRHNPDVIVVGEIRDAETAELAVRLALTGHLILATVHATTAVQAISRLVDLGIPGSILASTIRLMVGQRLIRRLCPQCRKPHPRSRMILADRQQALDRSRRSGLIAEQGALALYEPGGGCETCARTGYAGRVGIFECRTITRDTADLLSKDAGRFSSSVAEEEFAVRSANGDAAARSLREDGLLKAVLGLISWEEVLANTALVAQGRTDN